MKNKESEVKVKILDLVLDRMNTLIFAVDRELGKKLIESLNQSKMKQESNELTPDNFATEWEKMLTYIPKSISLDNSQNNTRSKLPKFSKSQLRKHVNGIQIESRKDEI